MTESESAAQRNATGPEDGTEKRIWACLLTNKGYLRGVLTLYYSLVRSRTKYPFYVIYTEVPFP
jgi:hypothetical protein